MHQLVLIIAMTATTGLFGGGKHCGKPHHGKKALAASSCYSASPCGVSYALGRSLRAGAGSLRGAVDCSPTPRRPRPSHRPPPAPAKMAPPAPPAPTPSSAYLDPNGSLPIVSTGGLR